MPNRCRPACLTGSLRACALGLLLLCVEIRARGEPSADGLWDEIAAQPATAAREERWVNPQVFRPFRLDEAGLRKRLESAPLEFTKEADRTPLQITLPYPDGTYPRFEIVESPIMEADLAAKFPEITTYAGRGIDDPAATARLDLTPAGFHAQVLSPRGAVYVDPEYRGKTETYASYYKRDLASAGSFDCQTSSDRPSRDLIGGNQAPAGSGPTLYTYRLACAATGEYTAFHGGTVGLGLAAVVTTINRVDGIYETELAIRLILVANNNLLIYTNAGSDPYSNGSPGTLLDQNQNNLDAVIGNANYDVGHVFGTGGGGLAALGVICRAGLKAMGETGKSSPTGDAFDVDYVAHELGHQFGAGHTFNSPSGSCSGNRDASTAYERGSGSTIMAYAGICGADNLQAHSDPYFHSASFDQIIAYTRSGSGSGCAGQIATGNIAPTVDAGAAYTIPKETPFVLTAMGSDDNGDTLLYSWEERDLGPPATLGLEDDGEIPLFRVWAPETSPSRTFPRLENILAGGDSPEERLPTVARAMNFRVTARDNRPGGGGVNTADTTITVDGAAGPFVVNFPNANVMLPPGELVVAWAVAGTDMLPVGASQVNIRLSTDGGESFPFVLAAATANDGSESVVLPSIATSRARIKVEADGNIFFDISDQDFILSPPNYSEISENDWACYP